MKKVIIISGASNGIGAATAELFAGRGYRVFDLSRTGVERPGIRHITCDVTSEQSCREAISLILAETGQIDVCICNAGMGISGPVEFSGEAEARKLMDVNFFGAVNLAKAVLPAMRSRKCGRILFTSSVAALLPVPYQAYYSASKAAINALTLSLQNEVREFGIQVACLMPGDVRTGFTSARRKSEQGSDVYLHTNKAVAAMENDEQNGMQPEQMARIFWRMAESRCMKTYYVGGFKYKLFCLLQRILPTTLTNRIEGMLYS